MAVADLTSSWKQSSPPPSSSRFLPSSLPFSVSLSLSLCISLHLSASLQRSYRAIETAEMERCPGQRTRFQKRKEKEIVDWNINARFVRANKEKWWGKLKIKKIKTPSPVCLESTDPGRNLNTTCLFHWRVYFKEEEKSTEDKSLSESWIFFFFFPLSWLGLESQKAPEWNKNLSLSLSLTHTLFQALNRSWKSSDCWLASS